MSTPTADPTPVADIRCLHCDTLNESERAHCIGCGHDLALVEVGAVSAENSLTPTPKKPNRPIRNPILKLTSFIISIAALWMAFVIFRNPQALASATTQSAEIAAITATVADSAMTTATATVTLMPTPTSVALRSPTPTTEPTATPTPLPTPTMQPPDEHIIQPGEALYNLALRYSVSIDSIIAVNQGLSPDAITSGQAILVPRPTATPPLEPVAVVVNGETVIADPTDCIQHEIQDGDSYFAVANRYNISVEAILIMNRLTETNLLRPGDTVCIPSIVYGITTLNANGAVSLDRTTSNIVSPRLLYPAPDAIISFESNTPTSPLTLQWVAERDLAPNEWYMVEITNLSDATSRPQRIFARQTSVQLLPQHSQDRAFAQQYRWRVSYITMTNSPTSASLSYAFNGTSSESNFTLD